MDEVTITNGFRWSVIAQFRVESLINPAQQDKISILKAGVDRANPNFVEGTLITIFPWEDILDKEFKLVAKQNSQLSVIDFSKKSPKTWCQYLAEIFDLLSPLIFREHSP